MAYVAPDATSIVRRIVARIVARTDGLSDLREGSEMGQLVAAFGRELESAYAELANLRDARVLDRMVGRELDDYAQEIGARPRGEGGFAHTYVRFARPTTSGALTLASGTLVARTDGVAYRTQASATINDGSTTSDSVHAIAVVRGESGNAEASTVIRVVSAVGGVTATNPVRAEGGINAQGDPEYREVIRRHTRTLGRCNRSSLIDRALQAEVNERQVLFARLLHSSQPNVSLLYVDDGAGGLESDYNTLGGETLLNPAVGGEVELYGSFRPWRTKPVVFRNSVALTEGVDYTVSRPEGRIRLLSPATAGAVYALGQHTYWNGLVAEANRLIYGDPSNLADFPPYVAEGGAVLVQGARRLAATVSGVLLVNPGFNRAVTIARAQSAMVATVNRLNIGQPLFASALIAAAHRADPRAVLRVQLTTPDIYPDEDQVIRVTADDVQLGSAGG
jgi:hypothetical protein